MKKQIKKLKEWWLVFRYGDETPIYYQTVKAMGYDPLAEKDKHK